MEFWFKILLNAVRKFIEVVEGFVQVGLMAASSWFRVDVVPAHFMFSIGLRFGLELVWGWLEIYLRLLVWGWLEIYLRLICGLLKISSRFNENLCEGGFKLYFKIVGALLKVSLSFSFRLVKVFL